MLPNVNMINLRTSSYFLLAIALLAVLLALNLSKANAASDHQIVAADLLTVKEPKSEAESRTRVIRLTTRGGSAGYGDYLDYGLPAEDAEEALARMVNRYALQNYKPNIFMPDPSMRAVGAGHTGSLARRPVTSSITSRLYCPGAPCITVKALAGCEARESRPSSCPADRLLDLTVKPARVRCGFVRRSEFTTNKTASAASALPRKCSKRWCH